MKTLYVAIDESAYSLRGLVLGELLNQQLNGQLVVASVASSPDQVARRREALCSMLDQEGLTCHQDSLQVEQGGHVADTLIGLVAGQDDAMLCMTSHGRCPSTERFLGSVAAQAIRRSQALVMLGGPRFDPAAQARIDTLMVCVDGSTLAETVLPQAVALARGLGARLQLLQVVEVKAPVAPVAAVLPGAGGDPDVMEAGYLHGLAHRIRAQHRFEVDWEVLHGYEPAESLVSYLADQPNVMAVMTTHGRSGLSPLAAGSVSHEVLHEARCPVAVMRPALAG
jgi:nucleotide-binding universal stress UspA family protein